MQAVAVPHAISYFEMFKQNTNLVRGTFPTFVVDLHEATLTIGIQEGFEKGAWRESMRVHENYYWKMGETNPANCLCLNLIND